MKPLSLEFNAFGSYPGAESIDFASLAELGLYLVTGPTGSGKTTIFDAMAYALYGEVPGEREKGDVRSQHASSDAVCSVTFRFEIDGSVYRVTRTPEQFKPRERGQGDPVKVVAKANLVREADEFALESGLTKVTKACIDLIGLDAAQFERVVLLPQGQFQKFLLADTAERLPLLRRLFGTGKWLDVVDDLKTRARDASVIVADINEQLGRYRFAVIGDLEVAESLLTDHDAPNVAADGADVDSEPIPDSTRGSGSGAGSDSGSDSDRAEPEPGASGQDEEPESLDDLAIRLEGLDVRASALGNEVVGVGVEASAAEAALTEATTAIDNWDKRVGLVAERAELDESAPSMDGLRDQQASARAAAPVLTAFADRERFGNALAEAVVVRESAFASLGGASTAAGLGDLRDPDAVAVEVTTARRDNKARQVALEQLQSATLRSGTHAARIAELSGERGSSEIRIAEIARQKESVQGEIAALSALAATAPQREVLVMQSARLVEWRAELDRTNALIPEASAAQEEASRLQREAIRQFDDAAAPRLAESLIPDNPCPVCGSKEHPSPALSGPGGAVDSGGRDAATAALRAAGSTLDRLGARCEELVASLGENASSTLAELQVDRDRIAGEHAAAVAAIAELERVQTTAAAAAEEQALISERLNTIDIETAGLEPRVAAATSEIAQARTELGDLAETWDADPDALIELFARLAAALDSAEGLIGACRVAAAEVTTAEAAAKLSMDALEAELQRSPFATLEDAQACELTAEQLSEIDGAIQTFDARNSTNRTLLDEIGKLVIPVDRPDATDLRLRAEWARKASDAIADSHSRVRDRLDQARTDLGTARGIEGDAAGANVQASALQALAKTCDGQGPKRIALETWVLAGELEHVAAAANHHLDRMTAGRFRIERSDAAGRGAKQSGLDLRVLDAHTGSSRRPGSLSGGEQFQASLALALGLADVIGHGGKASGRVFEALFVDEGFGSLDPESLNQAVDALVQIQATGRTVGVITHVETMKETLNIGINVERLPGDRGSTLKVRPNG
jgi:exonuclease SbcC